MQTGPEGLLDRNVDPQAFGQTGVRANGGMFVNGPHEHHTIEDTHYFPKLQAKTPRWPGGFDILDADHHALDGIWPLRGQRNGVLTRLDDRARCRTGPQRSMGASLNDMGAAVEPPLRRWEDLKSCRVILR